ncbi:MAG: 50S ribosomal protein L18 [bacterium]|nr:50S ribosomal protein L18 [bacterium]
MEAQKKRNLRIRRHRRLRKKITGTAERPRLAVFKSLKHFYAQAIDDINGTTLAAASSLIPDLVSGGGNIKVARAVGELMAQNCKKAGIKKIVFDHGGFGYCGKIKAFAEVLRKNGLEF